MAEITSIFHTLNSGLIFSNRDAQLLIDVLHNGADIGFSPFPNILYDNLIHQNGVFNKKSDIVFTHCHPDHFDDNLLKQYRSLYPNNSIYVPQVLSEFCKVTKTSNISRIIQTKHFTLYAFQTCHEGTIYHNVFHLVYMLDINGAFYIISGDAILDNSLYQSISQITHDNIGGIFVNPYQLNNSSNYSFFKKLNSKKIFIYHLPTPEDDIYNYHALATHALKCAQKIFSDITLLPSMSDITGIIL